MQMQLSLLFGIRIEIDSDGVSIGVVDGESGVGRAAQDRSCAIARRQTVRPVQTHRWEIYQLGWVCRCWNDDRRCWR